MRQYRAEYGQRSQKLNDYAEEVAEKTDDPERLDQEPNKGPFHEDEQHSEHQKHRSASLVGPSEEDIGLLRANDQQDTG